MKNSSLNKFNLFILIIALLAVMLEFGLFNIAYVRQAVTVLDILILALFILEYLIGFLSTRIKKDYIKENLFGTVFLIAFTALFIYNRYIIVRFPARALQGLSIKIIIICTRIMLV